MHGKAKHIGPVGAPMAALCGQSIKTGPEVGQPVPAFSIMKPPTAIPVTKQKKWSKWLKVSGAAILLFAFGMQNQQNAQVAISLERTQAAELQSRTKTKAIGYETLYFSAKATGLVEPQYLQLAALQYFIGSSAMIATAPGGTNEKAMKIHSLQVPANAVHDFDSFRIHHDGEGLLMGKSMASIPDDYFQGQEIEMTLVVYDTTGKKSETPFQLRVDKRGF